MIVSINEGIKARYESHRSNYVQSVVLFVAMVIVTTLAVLSWFFNGTNATLASKLCASYLFMTINLFALIGKRGFNRTFFVLTQVLDIEPVSFETSTAIFVVFSLDASISSFVCMLLALFDVELGMFGIIHLFLGYIPMALLTLIVLPNKLYMLFRRRDAVKKYKKRLSS